MRVRVRSPHTARTLPRRVVPMSRHVWRPAVIAAGCAIMLISGQPVSLILQARATIETIIPAGLVNPRGLNFGPEGALYIAEAGSGGSGPCITNSNREFVCY